MSTDYGVSNYTEFEFEVHFWFTVKLTERHLKLDSRTTLFPILKYSLKLIDKKLNYLTAPKKIFVWYTIVTVDDSLELTF